MQLQDARHSANSLKYIFQTSVCEYKITNMKIRHFNTSNFLFSQVYKPQVLKLSEKRHPILQNYFILSTTPNSKLHLLLLHVPSHPTSLSRVILNAPYMGQTQSWLLPCLQHLSVCSLDFLQFCGNVTFSEPYNDHYI